MKKLWGKNQNEAKDKAMAMGILSLFEHCYARGVKDACRANDEMMCREFIDNTDIPGQFGFLWKDMDARFDMNTWDNRTFIMEIIRLSQQEGVYGRNRLFQYLARIINPTTYHFCLLHVAQEFYKQGMLAYIQHPNPNKLYTIPESLPGIEWTKDGAQKSGRGNTLFNVYRACCVRAQRSEEFSDAAEKKKHVCSRLSFMNFYTSLNRSFNGVNVI